MVISGAGSPNVSTTTLAPGVGEGTYTLSGFGAGPYTITPSKSGGQNLSISSFDAARISQFVTGNVTLTPAQQIVSDVSGTGGISSFDAALVAKYAVAAPGTGSTGNWIFTPPSNTHASVTGSLTEDYSALLMGDVSGNWLNTGARLSRGVNGPERSTSVVAPNLQMAAKGKLLIPISVEGVADKDVIAYEFDLRYDPKVIEPDANPVDVVNTISRGLSVVFNSSEPGLLRVAVYGPTPIVSNGTLLNLRFSAVGSPGTTSPLTWERVIFNEGDLDTTVTNGQVLLLRPLRKR